jgi:anaphase-promoting complex subunit 12
MSKVCCICCVENLICILFSEKLSSFIMLRRPPTRLELKMEDIQEYEQAKRDLDNKKGRANIFGASPAQGAGAASANGAEKAPAKSRTEQIHERIGYDPNNRRPT